MSAAPSMRKPALVKWPVGNPGASESLYIYTPASHQDKLRHD